MPYCNIGNRECNTRASLNGLDAGGDIVDVMCRDGFQVAADCGETAVCGVLALEAHSEEVQVHAEIDMGDGFQADLEGGQQHA